MLNKELTHIETGLFVIAILAILFLNSNLANNLGLGNVVTTVSFGPFVVYFIYKIFINGLRASYNSKYIVLILLCGCLAFLIKSLLNQDMFKDILVFYILPYLLAYSLEFISKSQRDKLRNIVFLLFAVEIGIALFERFTNTVLFASEDSYAFVNSSGDSWSFRASALYGHPLANAMIVMIIILFIISSEINRKKKILLLALAFMGLFCFNERGNILVTFACTVPMLYSQIKKLSYKEKMRILFLFIIISISIVCILLNTDLGGRLFYHDSSFTKDDSSMTARFEALASFGHLTDYELWWGDPELYDKLLLVMNLVGIENGFVSILLKYGIVIGGITLLLFFFFYFHMLKGYYSFWSRFFILLAFYSIAFTNPHIAGPRPWLIFIVSYYAFRPQYRFFYK